jgi:23S rRNA (cytosine1962-C5)-methyltransferase
MTEAGQLLVCADWRDYELLDCGAGRKLERFGGYRVSRPDPQALWAPAQPIASWRADAVFAARDDEDERGAWSFPGRPPPDAWPVSWQDLKLNARLQAFRHMGVFPEHSTHWRWAMAAVERADRPVRVLNLFGYTGLMSLALARAGAEVTHLDASPKSIAQGRDNQALSGLSERPIRWICDDAMAFVRREQRRGRAYDAIVLDPPKFGRGPKGETWRFETDFPELLSATRKLLSERPLFVIATVYAVRLSWISVAQALDDAMNGLGGRMEAGEMAIRAATGRLLPTGLFARWSA